MIMDPESRDSGGARDGARRTAVDLVLIGHVGLATDRTVHGTSTTTGGSGYAVAVGASVAFAARTGLVAQVGRDIDLRSLRRLGLDLEGVAILPGMSPTFHIDQFHDGSRSFKSTLGVAASPQFESLPDQYFHAEHVHLGTAPPSQQFAWLRFLRQQGYEGAISVDAFEHFVSTEPTASREVCDRADLIFANEFEYNSLYGDGGYPKVPAIVKRGSGGADYVTAGAVHHAPAPRATAVDTTGAGEILAGVFLALSVRGMPEAIALRYAVRAATSSVTECGVGGPNLARELEAIRKEVKDSFAVLR
jgi:ribokinase